MAKSLSEQILNTTVDNVNNGWRNLQSVALEPFYVNLAKIGSNEVVSRTREVIAFRQANGLPTPSSAVIAEQVSNPTSRANFIQTLRKVGMELEFKQDLVEAASSDLVPQIGDPTIFAENTETSLSISAIRAKLATIDAIKNSLETPETSKHIVQSNYTTSVDEDARVRQGLEQAYNYVRLFLQTTTV
jgi:hypothetical protein